MIDTIAEHDSCIPLREQARSHGESLVVAVATLVCRVAGTRLRSGRSCLVLAGSDVVEREALLVLQVARLQGAWPLLFAGSGTSSLAEKAKRLGADAAETWPLASTPDRVLCELCRPRVEHAFCIGVLPEGLRAALSVTADDGEVVVLDRCDGQDGRLNFYPDLHRRQVSLRGIDRRCEPTKRQMSAAEWLVRTGRIRVEG
ncbi:MAG: hypothetical protein WBC44_08145 [Planctomycetaceae bacterium]